MLAGDRTAAARQRWRKLRTAAFILRMLRSRSPISTSAPRKSAPFRESLLSEYSPERKMLLTRALAKPFWSRSEVDVKLLAELLRQCKFSPHLSSASHDALAQVLQIRMLHDGEIVFRQGDAVEEMSERFLVICGSLLVFSRDKESDDDSRSSADHDGFGELIDICNPGTSCGEDATLGAIVRKTTVLAQRTTMVACVTQADYLRIVRFDVETEAEVLDRIRIFFEDSGTPSRLDPTVLIGRSSMRVVKRFLHRYECFRMLPHDLLVRAAQALQCHTFRLGDNVTSFYSGKPRMFMVISGDCCVQAEGTLEEGCLKASSVNQYVNSATSTRTTHICTLSGGESFGGNTFLASLLSFQRQPAESTTIVIVRSGANACCIASIALEDFEVIRFSYLNSMAFQASSAYSTLSSKLPRDRTCEQIHYLAVFLIRHSTAKMFFRQIPAAILRQICLQATLEKYPMGKETMACIQEQGKQVMNFRVVLDGHLGVFHNQSNGNLHNGTLNNTESVIRRQAISRETSGLVASIRDGQNANSSVDELDFRENINRGVDSCESSGNFTDFFGIICPGSAFGLLQILLKSTSPFGYLHSATAGSRSANTATNLLSLAAPVVRLYLTTIDESLVYHPTRALKQVAQAQFLRANSKNASSAVKKWQVVKEFERLVFHCPAVSGIPRTKLQVMVRRMQIVDVPAHYFLYEAGDITKGCIFIILQGSVRVFRRSMAGKSKPSVRTKNSRKAISELSRSMAEASQKPAVEEASTPERIAFGLTKRVDEEFLTREYDYVESFEAGDGFGRHGPFEGFQGTSPFASFANSSSKQSLLVRRASNHRIHSRKLSVVHNLYPETAITMSNCRLGILCSANATEERFKLDPAQKDELLKSLQEPFAVTEKHNKIKAEAALLTLETRWRILERMNLAKRLKTDQLVKAASALRYIEFKGGETVYRRYDEGSAVFFVLSGQVCLFAGQESRGSKSTSENVTIDDYWSLDVSEGDVFGEEAFFTCFSSINRRLTSAVTVVEADRSARVGLVYLLLEDFRAATSSMELVSSERDQKPVVALRMEVAVVRKRSIVERWKAAAFQVTRNRWQWNSNILSNQQRRIALTFDVIKHVPMFRDLRKGEGLEVCKYCTIQMAALESVIIGRDDDKVEDFFLIVEGSIAVQQSCSLPLSIAGISASSFGSDGRPARVILRVLKPGECFGEAELLLENFSTRLVDAVVTSSRAKLLRVPKEVLFTLWPQKEALKSKLGILKQAFDATSPLDPDQLCSLYYAMREYGFKRNDVVSAVGTRRGTLLVIESGLCIVHDYVKLQRKRPRGRGPSNNGQSNNPAPLLALDTRVATLGSGTIIFADEMEKTSKTDSLAEYIVADSPNVGAFGIELIPETQILTTSSRRSQELLVFALLGRMGLQRIRQAITIQRDRRVRCTAHSIRLAEKSAPTESLYPTRSSVSSQFKRNVGGTRNASVDEMNGSSNRIELLQYLRDRQLPADLPSPNAKNEYVPHTAGPACPAKPKEVTIVPSKPSGPNGSFGTGISGLFPVLGQAGYYHRYVKEDAPYYVDPAVVAATMRTAQLIKETRVVSELSQRPQVNNASQLVAAKEKYQRQRHGRPPPSQKLITVLAPSTPYENDKIRPGFCRRLLHFKDGSHK